MRTTKFFKQSLMVLMMLAAFTFSALSQTKKPTLTVLNIDTKGLQLDAQQMGNLVRIELEKLDSFDVTDRYDVAYVVEKNKLNITNCYGKLCLIEIGNIIKTDFMFTGSAELYGQTIVVTFRLLDLNKASVVKTQVMEFLNLPLEVQQMTGITIHKMFNLANDEETVLRLTKKFNYENSTNNPYKERLNLQGPRFGYCFIAGEQANTLGRAKNDGGYDAYPAMFQFGYQFEKQYLNEGNYQALFEFIPLITGIDQQLVIPSITMLNGFRNNKNGWEIAIGPSIGFATYEKTANYKGRYYTESELKKEGITGLQTERRLDSRGDIGVSSALVIAIGKTIKSGKMNIPLNVYASIPTRDGFRVGISVGYNSKK